MCSKCQQPGHNARSKTCPGNQTATAPIADLADRSKQALLVSQQLHEQITKTVAPVAVGALSDVLVEDVANNAQNAPVTDIVLTEQNLADVEGTGTVANQFAHVEGNAAVESGLAKGSASLVVEGNRTQPIKQLTRRNRLLHQPLLSLLPVMQLIHLLLLLWKKVSLLLQWRHRRQNLIHRQKQRKHRKTLFKRCWRALGQPCLRFT